MSDESIDLTPTAHLIMEVLAARWRCGEIAWNFPTKHRRALDELSTKGLIWWKYWTIPDTALAQLTDAGIAAWRLDKPYTPITPRPDWDVREVGEWGTQHGRDYGDPDDPPYAVSVRDAEVIATNVTRRVWHGPWTPTYASGEEARAALRRSLAEKQAKIEATEVDDAGV